MQGVATALADTASLAIPQINGTAISNSSHSGEKTTAKKRDRPSSQAISSENTE